jgi:hypothetical protein
MIFLIELHPNHSIPDMLKEVIESEKVIEVDQVDFKYLHADFGIQP